MKSVLTRDDERAMLDDLAANLMRHFPHADPDTPAVFERTVRDFFADKIGDRDVYLRASGLASDAQTKAPIDFLIMWRHLVVWGYAYMAGMRVWGVDSYKL